MPRHYSLMHAIGNKAVESWLQKNMELPNVKFDDLVPNIEQSRDEAWLALDKDVRDQIAKSNVGIYQYTFHRDMAYAINIHNAATCLSSMDQWVERPVPAAKNGAEKELVA